MKQNKNTSRTLISIFNEIVLLFPDKTAIYHHNSSVSYKQLDNITNHYANFLIDNGVKPEDLVAVFMDRSIHSIIATLSIIKAGAAYLPLNTTYHSDRLEQILSIASPKMILTKPENINKINSRYKCFSIDDLSANIYTQTNLQHTVQDNPKSLAYVIFTSGSTGAPKGVMIEHKSIIRLVKDQNYLNFKPEINFLHLSNISFDAATFEIWGALLNGSALIIVDDTDVLLTKTYLDLGQRYKNLCCFITTSLFESLIIENTSVFRSYHAVLFGGESCHAGIIKRYLKAADANDLPKTLLNMYGPTECTTFATFFECTMDLSHDAIPIGRAINKTECIIIRDKKIISKKFIEGELYLGGEGLARGYCSDLKLTEEKFIFHPLLEGIRLYKTGDRVHYGDNGEIIFLGRFDNQIKLRGYRIELDEIETKVTQLREVESAVIGFHKGKQSAQNKIVAYLKMDPDRIRHPMNGTCIIKRLDSLSEKKYKFTNISTHGLCLQDQNDEFLVDEQIDIKIEQPLRIDERAKVVWKKSNCVGVMFLHPTVKIEPDKDEQTFMYNTIYNNQNGIISFLKSRLPDYMLPSRFFIVDEFKYNLNYKIDRHRLADVKAIEVKPKRHEIMTEIEKRLMHIWKRILAIEPQSTQIDFASLGGNSLLAIKLANLVNKSFNASLSYYDLLEYNTIAKQAKLLSQQKYAKIASISESFKNKSELSIEQSGLCFYDKLMPGTSSNIIIFSLDITGIFDLNKFSSIINKIVQYNKSLNIYFTEDPENKTLKLAYSQDEKSKIAYIDLSDSNITLDGFIDNLLIKNPPKLDDHILLSTYVLKKSKDEHTVVWAVHHAIFDGLSLNIFIEQFIHLYCKPKSKALPKINKCALSYIDYSLWQSKDKSFRDELGRNLNFWHNTLIGAPRFSTIPPMHPRPETQILSSDYEVIYFSRHLSSWVNQICKHHQFTQFNFFIGLTALVISAYNGQRDLVIGTPVTTRTHHQLENMIGYFVQTIPSRISFSDQTNSIQYFKDIQSSFYDFKRHSLVKLEKLTSKLNLDNDLPINNLFQILVVYNEINEINIKSKSYKIKNLREIATKEIYYDLIFEFVKQGNRYSLKLHYARELYDTSLINEILENFKVLTKSFKNSTDGSVHDHVTMIRKKVKAHAQIPFKTKQISHESLEKKNTNEFLKENPSIVETILGIWHQLLPSRNIESTDSFFSVGGNSLLIHQMIARIKEKFDAELSFRDIYKLKTPIGIAEYIYGIQKKPIEETVFSNEKGDSLITPLQKQIWYIEKAIPYNHAYHIPILFRLSDNPDLSVLNKIINYMIDHNSNFKSAFIDSEAGVEPKLISYRPLNFQMTVIECAPSDKFDVLYTYTNLPFDLSAAPLFRAGYISVNDDEKFLIFVCHHIIMDGLSINLFLSQLTRMYNALSCAKDNIFFDELKNKNQSHVYIQNKSTTVSHLQYKKECEFWKSYLKHSPIINSLPVDYKRKSGKRSFNGDRLYFEIPDYLYHQVEMIANQNSTTVFSVFLSCFSVFLYLLSGRKNNTIAIPVSNRTQVENEDIMGLFLDVKPFFHDINPSLTIQELIFEISSNCTDIISSSSLSFYEILRAINYPSSLSHEPLCQILFLLQEIPEPDSTLTAISAQPCDAPYPISKYDLALTISKKASGIAGCFEYATDLFDSQTIHQWIDYWLVCLKQLIEKPKLPIDKVKFSLAQETNYLTPRPLHKNPVPENLGISNIVELWDKAVGEYSSEICLSFESTELTYKQCNDMVENIASQIQQRGAREGTNVILLFNRSIEFVVALLAVLKCGATFTPVESSMPTKRLQHMIKLTNAKLIITNIDTSFDLQVETVTYTGLINSKVSNHTYTKPKINQNANAYIIFTSGTTGIPKGVPIRYSSIFSRVFWWLKTFPLSPKDTFYNPFSINFDGFLGSLFWPLFSGARLVLPNEKEAVNPESSIDLILNNHVNHMVATPTFYDYILDDPRILESTLKNIYFAGEALTQSTFDKAKLIKNVNIFNFYGPTECTIISSYAELNHAKSIHVGKPVSDTTIYVLDEKLNTVPTGLYGEVYISGLGLSPGYLGNIQEKGNFLVHPNISNQKLYKTGDLGRWTHKGTLQLLGRKDSQIKQNGFRIELDEISSSLSSISGIKKSFVTFENNQIIAYIVSQLSESSIRQVLSNVIPSYMIPNQFRFIPYIPLKPNGKIDTARLQLQKPDSKAHETNDSILQQVIDIFQAVLKTDKIDPNQSFFSLGGYSLLVAKLLKEINTQFNKALLLEDIYSHSSALQLAKLIKYKNKRILNIGALPIEQVKKDLYLVENLKIDTNQTKGNSILITGANGFLGDHILNYLLRNTNKKVFVLTSSPLAITSKYKSYVYKRIFPIYSEMGSPYFNLDNYIYQRLQNDVGIIFNCAANVNHILPYENLRQTNVLSIVELLKLCSAGCQKRLIHLSTLSACFDKDCHDQIIEDIGTSEPTISHGGYLSTKWVSEQLLKKAHNIGFDIAILRPSLILENSINGKYVTKNNHLFFLAKAACQLGAAPKNFFVIDGLPVDFIAKFSILMAFLPKLQEFVYNLNHSHPISSDVLFQWIREEGVELTYSTINQWQQLAQAKLGENDDAYKVLPLYLNEADHNLHKINADKPTHKLAQNAHFISLLDNLNLQMPDLKKAQMKHFIQLLIHSS